MNPLFSRATLATLLIGVVCAGAHASAIEQLQQFTTSTQTAKGEFYQKVMSRSGKNQPPTSGDFAFARPGKFRWSMVKPYEQLIVADGEKVYLYDKDLSQLTIRSQGDAISATPAALLFGQVKVDKLFDLKDLGERDGQDWLQATPKAKESTFSRIAIGFKDGVPEMMEIHDALGQVTVLRFSRWVRGAEAGKESFKFSAPPGVDVIDATRGAK